MQSFEGPGSYILGIIDPLQRWTVRKRIERYFKILINCRCASDLREGMSAIEPVSYAKRFHERFGTEQLKLTLAEVRVCMYMCMHVYARMNASGRAAHARRGAYTLGFTLHTSHFTLRTSHFTLHTSRSTLHAPRSTLLTSHFAPHTWQVRADWDDESAARERERVRKEELAAAARAPWMYMGT